MPFDLMRHDLLMTLKPLPEERVLEIVDDLFMPLVKAAKVISMTGSPTPVQA